ncbi:unnamed protein product [Schistosoma intercalatum]|nr:unnamed protein product [Schistosoma intercalatum]CAH8499251.1 unnamed protein product [Schistosoma intercalatum]
MDENLKTGIVKESDLNQQNGHEKLSIDNIYHVGGCHQSHSDSENLEKLKTALRQALGLDPNLPKQCVMMDLEHQNRLSLLAIEMLIEQEDIDVHPYGRGGIYEGILYRNRPKEKINIISAFIWFVFVSSVAIMAGTIVTVAELYYFLKSENTNEDKMAFCNFFKNCLKVKPFQ